MTQASAPPARRPVRKGEEIALTIRRLAPDGRGVGEVDGYPVFVRGTAPGDEVCARPWRVNARGADADLISVTRPSPLRASPPCPYFGPCGGCVWQHVEYRAQAAAKERIVREALARAGGANGIDLRPIVAMADPWRYRNKMEFTFHPDGVLGLHRRGSFAHVVRTDACLLQPAAADDVLRAARGFAETSGIARYDPRAHAGVLRQLLIRGARASGELLVGVVTAAPDVPGLRAWAARLPAAVPRVAGVVHGVNPGLSDGLPLASVTVLAGRPYVVETLAGLQFKIGLETFFQTNTAQAEQLVETVVRLAGLRGGETVYDLYCGVGTFSLVLARRARRTYGIEIVRSAVEAARENAVLNDIANAEFEVGDARTALPALRARAPRPDLLVLDPPRGGAGAHVLRRVTETDAPRIVYVSCNPATLGPDLADLRAGGYAVRAAQPLDLFPHTHHVECAVLLERVPPA